jgi:hypothetical protein
MTGDTVRDTLTGHLTVATCIGCGARSRGGECPDGCADVALDLVDVVDLADAAERAEALEARVAALRELALTVAGDAPFAWAEVHERAQEAIRLPVPPEPDIAVIEAWGCPRCGRIDAPQPCLGVCVRRPGAVADASEYRRFAERSEQLAPDDGALTGLARLLATVTPRPGHEESTVMTVRARARDLLDRSTD